MPLLESSSLGTTQPYIPAVLQTQLGRFAGLHMHFSTLAALNLAIAEERENIGSATGIWPANQIFTVASEASLGVYRIWSTASQHARNVVLKPGVVVTLASDTATVLSTTGAPASGVGSNGDIAVDFSVNVYYVKSGGAWGSGIGIDAAVAAVFSTLTSHTGNATLHLSSQQNTFLDGLNLGSLTSTEVNYLVGVTSPIQTQINTLTTSQSSHASDTAVHLTAAQNAFLDGLNLPTLTAVEVNRLIGVTSPIQTQINNIGTQISTLTSHTSDTVLHLTADQNAFLDALNFSAESTSAKATSLNSLSTHLASTSVHLTAFQNTLLDDIESAGTVASADVLKLAGANSSTILSGTNIASAMTTMNGSGVARQKINSDGTLPFTANQSMGGNRLTDVGNPTVGTDAVNRDWALSNLQGFRYKDSVYVAATGNVTLNGTQTVDGVLIDAPRRVFLPAQTDPTENGIYLSNPGGSWTRTTDADTALELSGAGIIVEANGTQANTVWVQTGTLTTLGVDAVEFTLFPTAGSTVTAGQGINVSSGTVSVRSGNGLTFSGSDLALNVSARFALGTSLDLATVATPGTYRSVTINQYGIITDGTNPTTLLGYGITDAQPLSANLTAVAALASTGMLARTGTNTFAARTLAVSGSGLTITNATGASGNPTITSNATSTNTVSTLVFRDSSGNFSAGTITANLAGTATSATTATTATNATNLIGPGSIYSTTVSTSALNAVQVREVNLGGAQGSAAGAAPRLAFNWNTLASSALALETTGRLAVRNSTGTSYEAFAASNYYASGNIAADGDAVITGSLGLGITPVASVKLQVRAATNQNMAVLTQGSQTTITAITDAGASAPLRVVGNALRLSGNGSADHVYLTTAGSLGVGTSSPSYLLDVNDGGIGVGTKSASAGLGGKIYYRRDTGTLGWAAGILGSNAETAWSIYDSVAAIERFRVESGTGLVGIGRTPGVILDVQAAAPVFRLTASTGTNASYADFVNTGGSLLVGLENSAGNVFGTSTAYAGAISRAGAYPLMLMTNGGVRLHLDHLGNAGQGITPANYGAGIISYGINGTSSSLIDWNVNGTRTGTAIASASEFRVGSIASVPFNIYTAGTQKVQVDAPGNVGVGVTPTAKLDVFGTNIYLRNSAGNSALIEMAGNGNTAGTSSLAIGQDSAGVGYLLNRSGTNLLMGVGGSIYLRIESSGRVGVNRTATTYALEVGGDVFATNFRGALVGNATTATTATTASAVAFTGITGLPTTANWNTTTGAYGMVVGQLAWKEYGGGHVIFDASDATSPSGASINNTNPTTPWAPAYPTLMGWNGTNTYGVRVDSARSADGATTVGGFTPSASSGVASRVVVADGSGYIHNTYFNSTDNSATSGVTAVMVKAGDNYLRSGTAAAVAAFISGQTMNIAGNSSTATALQTARTINGVSFNGTANIVVADDTKLPVGGNAVSATTATNQSGGTIAATTGSIQQMSVTNGGGYLRLTHGDGSRTGYVEFYSSTAVRQGYIGYATTSGSDAGILQYVGGTHNFTGSIVASGDVTAFSDRRLKTDIRLIDGASAKADQLEGVYFTRLSDGKKSMGFIAQDAQAVTPEIVAEHEGGMLSVAYGNTVALLVEARKEDNQRHAQEKADLQRQVDELKTIVERLLKNLQ